MEVARRNLIRVVIDLIIAGISSMLVIKFTAVPFQRGFFCNDESIKFPYKRSTISFLWTVVCSFLIPSATILVTEGVRYSRHKLQPEYKAGPWRVHPYVFVCFYTIGLFLCGIGVTLEFVNLSKNGFGRLRPHFLAVCNPTFSALNCSEYIEGDVCDPKADAGKIEDARKSFFSGHAAVAMYAAVFLGIYLQARVSINRYTYTLRPVIQAWSVCLALYCGITRVSDYKHHWSDVLVGFLVGAGIAVITAYYISNLFKDTSLRTISKQLTDLEMQQRRETVYINNYGSEEKNLEKTNDDAPVHINNYGSEVKNLEKTNDDASVYINSYGSEDKNLEKTNDDAPVHINNYGSEGKNLEKTNDDASVTLPSEV